MIPFLMFPQLPSMLLFLPQRHPCLLLTIMHEPPFGRDFISQQSLSTRTVTRSMSNPAGHTSYILPSQSKDLITSESLLLVKKCPSRSCLSWKRGLFTTRTRLRCQQRRSWNQLHGILKPNIQLSSRHLTSVRKGCRARCCAAFLVWSRFRI